MVMIYDIWATDAPEKHLTLNIMAIIHTRQKCEVFMFSIVIEMSGELPDEQEKDRIKELLYMRLKPLYVWIISDGVEPEHDPPDW